MQWQYDLYTSKKPKRFDPKSRWVKYDRKGGLWIQSRKRVFTLWFKFLQHAELDPDRTVDWGKYRGWGGREVILNTKFDDWWKERWKPLFGVKNEGDEPKFPLSTKRPKYDGMRYQELVYRHRGEKNYWEIARKIVRNEDRKRYSVSSFYYARDDMSKQRGSNDIQVIQSRVSRFMKKANTILDNVCEGQFP